MPRIEATITLDEAIEAAVKAIGDASYNYFRWKEPCEFSEWQAERLEAAARLIRDVLKHQSGGCKR